MKAAMPSKLKKAIGAVKDQTSISLAKVASSTSLEVSILKATTHENIPTDERYIIEVVDLVSSDKSYAKSCARAIGRRIGRTRNWIVALKSLMLVLRIFQDGDPYFPREVLHATRRGAKILNLANFRDESSSCPRDYTAFVRVFALYLDERLDCFLTGKLQRRYTFKDTESGGHKRHRRQHEVVREMKPPMLLDRIIFWQRLLDRAIATSPTGAARTHRLVLISLYAIVQESFDLYKDVSDGLTLLLDGFFQLQYNLCVNAFEACVKASKQYEELIEYYSYCQSLGVGRTSEYPCVQTISQELMETLRQFLKDQSAFPAEKTPEMLALPAPPTPSSSRHEMNDSYGGESEFSEFSTSRYSGGVSDFRSQCTSLEELMNATDTVTRQGISIDLEAYNTGQFDNHSQQDDTLRTSDAGSTHSLPELNAMADLLCLDDWPEQSHKTEPEQHQSQLSSASGWDLVLAEAMKQQLDPDESNTNAFSQQEQKEQETSSADNWELVLAETSTQPIQQMPNINFSLDNLYNQSTVFPLEYATNPENQTSLHLEPDTPNNYDPFEPEHVNGQATSSGQGWELALAETATQPSQHQPDLTSSIENMSNQTETTSTVTYNPFLEESGGLATVPSIADPTIMASTDNFEPGFQTTDAISGATTPAYTLPTYQTATPTFSAQNPNENDPFSDLATEQMFNASINQQNLLHDQQSWLQQQNEIIAKHTA